MPGNQPLDMGYVGEKAKAYLILPFGCFPTGCQKGRGQEGANAEQRVYCKRQNLHEMREQVFGWDKIKIPHRECAPEETQYFHSLLRGEGCGLPFLARRTTFPSQMQ